MSAAREDLLDAIDDDDGTEDARSVINAARAEFMSRLREWMNTFNAYIQPALETAAREVLEMHQEQVEAASCKAQQGSEGGTANIDSSTAANTATAPTATADTPADPAAVKPAMPAPLPTSFPLREAVSRDKEVTGREARAHLGLPPLRDPRRKSEMWQEIFAISIPLPSSFDNLVLQRPAVASLVSWEKRVRQGQANDALSDLRTHLVTTEMLKIKKLDATGKSSTTRMGKKLRRQNDQVVAAADDYRRARLALIHLGMDEGDVLFRPLKKTDVAGFTMSTETQQLGDSRKTVSWIWEDFSFVERPGDLDHQEFYEEGRTTHFAHAGKHETDEMLTTVKRVHWFRSSALRARWQEEVRLLAEEMTRSVRFFGFQRRVWDIRAHARDATGDAAAAAYARKYVARMHGFKW